MENTPYGESIIPVRPPAVLPSEMPILTGKSISSWETARERIETLRRTDDGFEIAEADFKLRGPGDILGLRQAGATDYRVIDLSEDAALLAIAAKDAEALVTSDPDLESVRGRALRLVRELMVPRTLS